MTWLDGDADVAPLLQGLDTQIVDAAVRRPLVVVDDALRADGGAA